MKIQCEFCGSFIEDTDEKCPNCGADNIHLIRAGAGIPKTIEELQEFCKEHNIPLEKLRFFIGEDYQGAKAFGIYKDDNGNFVVYKNKSDGTRAERYRGHDEAYAVNEIYQKLRSELNDRKDAGTIVKKNTSGYSKQSEKPVADESTYSADGASPQQGRGGAVWLIIAAVVLIGIIVGICMLFRACYKEIDSYPNYGYYYYDDQTWYYDGDVWYVYAPAEELWKAADVEKGDELYDHYKDYWFADSSTFGPSEQVENDNIDYYVPAYYDYDSYYDSGTDSGYSYSTTDSTDNDDSFWDDDWDDDDWDYNYDSWDSGGTDWDSDW